MNFPSKFRKIRIEHFLTFQHLLSSQSFTKTADFLGKTQGSISQRMKEFEDALGFQVVKRTSKSFSITSEGYQINAWITRFFEDFSQTMDDIHKTQNLNKITIKISASSIPGSYILPQLFMDFRKTHPHLEFEIQISNTQSSFENLLDDTTVFCALGNLEGVDLEKFDAKKIGQDEINLFAKQSHPIFQELNKLSEGANLSTIKPLFLKYPWIFREKGSATRDLFLKTFPFAKDIPLGLEIQNNTAIIQAVEKSEAISALSSLTLSKLAENKEISIIKHPKIPTIHRFLYLVKKKDISLNRLEADFWKSL